MKARTSLVRATPIAVVAAATLVCFVPVLGHELLAYRDDAMVERASGLRLRIDDLRTLIAAPAPDRGPIPGYAPLTDVTFALDYRAWAQQPYGYHLTSLALHVLDAGLVYLLLAALLRAAHGEPPEARVRVAASGGALVWALHPLQVEAVAWASARATLLATTCMLVSVLAYLRAVAPRTDDDPPRAGWWATSLAATALAMLASASATVLPLVLLVLDAYPLRRLVPGSRLRVLREKAPYAALALAVALVAGVGRSDGAPPLGSQVAAAAYGLCLPLWKTALPIGLVPMYERVPPLDAFPPVYLASLIIAIGISAGLMLTARRWPAGLAAWTAYVVLVAPHLVGTRGPEVAADRWAYAATIPLAALAATGLFTLLAPVARRLPRAARIALGLVVLGVLAGLTARQLDVWQSTLGLWTYTVGVEPDNLFARMAVARALRAEGQPGGSVPHYEAILAMADERHLAPRTRAVVTRKLAEGVARLGNDALYEGDAEAAVEHLRRAVGLAPDDHRLRLRLGATYLQLARPQEALAELEEAIRVDPSDANTLNALGLTLMRVQRFPEAERRFRQALAIAPENAEIRTNLGAVLHELGRVDEAILQWEEALRLDPDLSAARRNLDAWHAATDG